MCGRELAHSLPEHPSNKGSPGLEPAAARAQHGERGPATYGTLPQQPAQSRPAGLLPLQRCCLLACSPRPRSHPASNNAPPPTHTHTQVKALEERGITALFPIQKTVFEPAMSGSDLIARAKTGSGKTLAFAIPVIEKILASQEPGARRQRLPQCLVLAPTRELAKQVRTAQASLPPAPLPARGVSSCWWACWASCVCAGLGIAFLVLGLTLLDPLLFLVAFCRRPIDSHQRPPTQPMHTHRSSARWPAPRPRCAWAATTAATPSARSCASCATAWTLWWAPPAASST